MAHRRLLNFGGAAKYKLSVNSRSIVEGSRCRFQDGAIARRGATADVRITNWKKSRASSRAHSAVIRANRTKSALAVASTKAAIMAPSSR